MENLRYVTSSSSSRRLLSGTMAGVSFLFWATLAVADNIRLGERIGNEVYAILILGFGLFVIATIWFVILVIRFLDHLFRRPISPEGTDQNSKPTTQQQVTHKVNDEGEMVPLTEPLLPIPIVVIIVTAVTMIFIYLFGQFIKML